MIVADAIKKVALNMSLINGTNMSPYSDDQVQNYLSNAHDLVVTKYLWPELFSVATRTLDGTTGKPTVGFTLAADGIDDYKQIKHVYIDSIVRELPQVSGYINPLITPTLNVGYSVLNIRDDPNKQFFIKIVPNTTVGQMAIAFNLKADFTDPNTVIPIDDLLHIWIATWMWAEDDATNPGQAEKYSNLWQDRATDLRANVNMGPYMLNPFNAPTQSWWEYGSPAA